MTAYDTAVLADHPILYWKLDEILAASTAADSSGNSNVGTVSAWNFQQPSQFVGSTIGSTAGVGGKILSSSIAFGSAPVTVEMWVNLGANSGTPTYMLFAFGISYLDLIVDTGVIGVNTGAADRYGCSVPTSGVHHVVAVMPNNQATTNAKIYIDGVQKALSGPSGTAKLIGTTSFQVSNWPIGGQAVPSGVYMDNVSAYLGELSAGQILTHYQAGLGLGLFKGWGIPV